jgi:hypothetical protein
MARAAVDVVGVSSVRSFVQTFKIELKEKRKVFKDCVAARSGIRDHFD